MIAFLLDNYKLIISGVFLVVSFILLLIKKRNITSILDDVYEYAILAINVVESDALLDPSFKGADKLNRAVSYVMQFLNNKYPGLNAEKYLSVIEKIIEQILTTPQKKG